MKLEQRFLSPDPVIMDGGLGTQIQALSLKDEDWGDRVGCNEILNLTAPDQIEGIHSLYLEAGAEVIETNSFGGSRLVLGEYDLQDKTRLINQKAARIARKAADAALGTRYVLGSLGPGSQLPSLDQGSFDVLYQSYLPQVQGLAEGGVDGFIVETCQDPLQLKAAVLAVLEETDRLGTPLPLIVTVTMELSGTMLVGTDMAAVAALLAPYPLLALGLNCGLGPEQMGPHLKALARRYPGPLVCQPNAGIPLAQGDRVIYPLSDEDFASQMALLVQESGVSVVGGCCGTTPHTIRHLAQKLTSLATPPRQVSPEPCLASLYSAQPLHQSPAPFFVGERANINGSRKFKKALLAEDWDRVVSISKEQTKLGAHGLDLCVAYPGRDESRDLCEAVRRLRTASHLPLILDTTDLQALEHALKLYGGRAAINSINLEGGEARAHQVCSLAKRFGAALIALTIDEQGMAMEASRKVEVARRLYTIAVEDHGLRPEDLIFDPLTFTLASGDPSLRLAAAETLEALGLIRAAFPGTLSLLGVSNISFGLSARAREVLNSVFLAEAVRQGLDLAIVNVGGILPLYRVPQSARDLALALVRGEEGALDAYIRAFQEALPDAERARPQATTAEERLRDHLIDGDPSGLEELINELLGRMRAGEILNAILLPAMKRVGDLFGAGEMQLPFVLQSAQVMKEATTRLRPHMARTEGKARASLVLATVRGDVHDIGKNLVKILLENNGFLVHDLGIKVEAEALLSKVTEVDADAVGMSGLLVRSTMVMREYIQELAHRGVRVPVLLGGAALTPAFVREACAPIYEGQVIYCKDAFEGLMAMEAVAGGGALPEAPVKGSGPPRGEVAPKKATPVEVPQPPFWGSRVVEGIGLEEIIPHINPKSLTRGRWQYRQGRLSTQAFQELQRTEIEPQMDRLLSMCRGEALLEPRVVYGYFSCFSRGDDLVVWDGQREVVFHFPRQAKPPFLSVADFFLPGERRDLVELQVVTVGSPILERAHGLLESHAYKDYLLLYGLAMEMAEALADLWNDRVRRDLMIGPQRGLRFSFGLPSCPELDENRKIFDLLRPERIGVGLTEEAEMVPEGTTSALICHHPQATYFSLR